MDQVLFHKVCDQVVGMEQGLMGIGTLREKTVHSVLKNYYETDPKNHEVRIDGFVADIFNQHEIIEIQTQGFDRLRKKLPVFLEQYPVTIVYPVPFTKIIRWVNPTTGEITPPRKSPKRGRPHDIFPELYKIKNLLTNPNLRIKIVMLNMEEYRFLDGWSEDKKKGSTRCDRIPTDLIEEFNITKPNDYSLLIPESLSIEFTSTDFKKASGLSRKVASTAVHILNYVGSIEKIGKKGRAYLYTKRENNK
ncbi:MAG: hypothetical protein GX321_07325 [Clostridiales bacterium]|nr:hypothetical protein [Clostridiales bacterium]